MVGADPGGTIWGEVVSETPSGKPLSGGSRIKGKLALSLLGLPTLLSMGATINISCGTLSCSELNFNFPLIPDPHDKILPDGVSLKTSPHIVPSGVRTNFTAQLQYTSMDGFCPAIANSTPSDNIVVTDQSFDGNISRILSYATSEWQPRTIPLATIDIRIREGDLAVAMNNSELPRLNFYKLRSQFKLNKSFLLNTCTLNLRFLIMFLTIMQPYNKMLTLIYKIKQFCCQLYS